MSDATPIKKSSNQVQSTGLVQLFSVEHAMSYGYEESIVIHHFQFYIRINAIKLQNKFEGRFWSFDTYEELEKYFPYWSYKQLRRIIKSLIDQEVLITGHFCKNPFDRKNWYAFKDQKKFLMLSDEDLALENPDEEADLGEEKKEPIDLPKRADASNMFGQISKVQTGRCYDTVSNTAGNVTEENTLPSLPVESAIADSECFSSSKSKKEKSYSDEVKELTSQLLEEISKVNPDYRPPGKLNAIHDNVKLLLENDQIPKERILEVFRWALADNIEKPNGFKGWSSLMCSKNPAFSLRKSWGQISQQAKSKKERKFAPCSDDNKAFDLLSKMEYV